MAETTTEPAAAEDIAALEQQIYELTQRLTALRRDHIGDAVPDYPFATDHGATTLGELFGGQETLLVIHNMGQGCRYCTLWADELNGILPHLESAMAVVLVSRDAPDVQRRFAASRGWRFRLASHGGGAYIQEQTVQSGAGNMPGAVVYVREGETIRRKSSAVFGPGDLYSAHWNYLALAGLSDATWTPQFNYWQRPAELDDGGRDVLG